MAINSSLILNNASWNGDIGFESLAEASCIIVKWLFISVYRQKKYHRSVRNVAMVLVAAIALGSSTYAWFAVNSKVTATGMNFTATVQDNLFIATDTLASTAKKADSDFTTALVQNVSGLLQPVSTVDGKNYFYSSTANVKGDGDTKTDEWIAYNAADTSAFNTNYSTSGAVGYIDYVYQLKAVNGTANPLDIRLTNIGLTFNAASDPQKTFRAAVFAEDITSAAPAGTVGTLKAIYTVNGATNFTSGKAVKSTSTLDTVTYNGSSTLTAAANTSTYYKIVVRLWIEGEDTTCNNTTFADLNNGKWALNCEWTLNDGTAISNITETATAVADLSSASVDSSTTVVINGVTYTKINAVQLDSKDLYVEGTTLTSTSKIYQIDSNLYPIEVTHRCKLPAPVGP